MAFASNKRSLFFHESADLIRLNFTRSVNIEKILRIECRFEHHPGTGARKIYSRASGSRAIQVG
jgi:hypothetical protein